MSPRSESLRDRLRRFGNADDFPRWKDGEPNYVAALELTADDVGDLIALTQEWTQLDSSEDENDVTGFAPVHAWRCLAQLGAAQAAGPLLALLDPLDELGDDWYPEELPDVFAAFGPDTLPALREYLSDSSHAVFNHVCAAQCLCAIAQRQPKARAEVVGALAETLAKFQDTDPTINAHLVDCLLELKAVEAAEVIERAHAADRVDILVNGNWNMVRKELGVSGLGLVPPELASQKRHWPFPSNLTSQFLSSPDDLGEARMYEPKPTRAPARMRRSPLVAAAAQLRVNRKIGRNEPCPCKSGKKYKNCCGR